MSNANLVEQIKAKAFTHKVWVATSPEKAIPNLKGATQRSGYFKEQDAIPVEDVLAIMEPLMAHLQNFPDCWNVDEPSGCKCKRCRWKEELDKIMGIKK